LCLVERGFFQRLIAGHSESSVVGMAVPAIILSAAMIGRG